jgi:acyl-CoA synthetase (AMP-forming)/AMP-acid ligase II
MSVHHATIQARLYNQLENNPGGRAISFYDQNGKFSWYTYEQFHGKAAGYAVQLAERGLGKGDVCLIVLPSNEFSATLILANLLLGSLPLLIAPPSIQGKGAYSNLAQVLAHVIGKTRPRMMIGDDSMVGLQDSFDHRARGTRFIFGENGFSAETVPFATRVVPGEKDIAAMQLTSGTTGMPRVCVWKQEGVIAALDGMATAMELSAEDVCLNWTPLFHDMGLVNNFFLCLTRGLPLVMLSPNDFVKKPVIWLRGLHDTGSTLTWSPNFGFTITAQRVRDSELQGVRLDGVRAFYSAAERIHYETMQAFYARFAPIGLRYQALKTNFGCAENVGGATFSDPQGEFIVERIDRSTMLEKRIARPVGDGVDDAQVITVVGVGKPHPAMKISILSPTGRALPDGHVGEVGLKTPSRMAGYLQDARANRHALFGDLLRTGDLGYLRGEELFWVGRVRERITIRGVKLDPSDFEPILLQVDGLRTGCFAAFGVDDQAQGTQRIVIVTEVRNNVTRTPQEISAEIRDQVFERLGVNVNEIVLVKQDTLTKTSSGKRRHRHFRNLYLEGKMKPFEWEPEPAAN